MVWLIGNKGMLGTELSLALGRIRVDHIGTDREVDITDLSALEAFAADKKISWIVNCAAYTAVDKAEDEPELARSLNTVGAGNIACTAEKFKAKMVHISTDYVFGAGSRYPFKEEDPVSPVGVYAVTKADGEVLVRKNCPRHFIFRTAWLYGEYGNNFVFTMLRLMKEKSEIGVVQDQRGTPTWSFDLASVIAKTIERDADEYGTYHYTNEGKTNWYDFARYIHTYARQLGILDRDCEIKPLKTDQYPTKAPRPRYSLLSKKKINSVMGVVPPEWPHSLEQFLKLHAPR